MISYTKVHLKELGEIKIFLIYTKDQNVELINVFADRRLLISKSARVSRIQNSIKICMKYRILKNDFLVSNYYCREINI